MKTGILAFLALLCGQFTLATAHADTASVIATAKPAVVFIRHRNADGVQSTGSGFIISPAGYLVTCAHVIEEVPKHKHGLKTAISDKVWVRLSDDSTCEATRCYVDASNDIAILRIPGSKYRYLKLETSSIAQGAEVLVLGYPLGQALGREMVVTRGIVSAIRAGGSVLQIDAAMNPGNSGGPIVNERGRVVGVSFAKLAAFEGTNFAVSASLISLTKAATPTPGNIRELVPSLYISEESKNLLQQAKNDSKPGRPDAINCYKQIVADPTIGSTYLTQCYREMADIYAGAAIYADFKAVADSEHTEVGKTRIAERDANIRLAVDCYKQALREDDHPDTAVTTYRGLASIYNTAKQWNNSLDASKQALAAIQVSSEGETEDLAKQLANACRYEVYCTMAGSYIGQCQYAEAEDILKKAIAQYPDGNESKVWAARAALADVYVKIGDKTRALQQYQLINSVDNASARLSAQWLYYRINN